MFLPMPTLADAIQSSHAAQEHRYPNRVALQLAAHNNNPFKYPHPDSSDLGWDSDCMHDIIEAEDGTCEIELPEADKKHYTAKDQGKMTTVRAIMEIT